MPVSDFHDLMPHTVYHSEFSGRSDYGKPNFGSAVPYRARVLYQAQNVRTADGNVVSARGVVWIGGTPDVQPEDQLLLPDSSTPPILSVDHVPDEDGLHHLKVYFG